MNYSGGVSHDQTKAEIDKERGALKGNETVLFQMQDQDSNAMASVLSRLLQHADEVACE